MSSFKRTSPERNDTKLESRQVRKLLEHQLLRAATLGCQIDHLRHLLHRARELVKLAPEGLPLNAQTALDTMTQNHTAVEEGFQALPGETPETTREAAWVANTAAYVVANMMLALIGGLRRVTSQSELLDALERIEQDQAGWERLANARTKAESRLDANDNN